MECLKVAIQRLARISSGISVNIQRLTRIKDMHSGYIDQLIYRFSKLQNTMGEKLFPAILLLLKEDVKPLSFIDRLNRLEELEMIEADAWLRMREIRNEIAHEYSFNRDEVVQSINLVYRCCDDLLVMYDSVKKECVKRGVLSVD